MEVVSELKRKYGIELEHVVKRMKMADDTIQKNPLTAQEFTRQHEELVDLKSRLENDLSKLKDDLSGEKITKKGIKAEILRLTVELAVARFELNPWDKKWIEHKAKIALLSILKGIISEQVRMIEDTRRRLSDAQKRLDDSSSQDLDLAKVQQQVETLTEMCRLFPHVITSYNEDISKEELEMELLKQHLNPLNEKVFELETKLEKQNAALKLQKVKIKGLENDIVISSWQIDWTNLEINLCGEESHNI